MNLKKLIVMAVALAVLTVIMLLQNRETANRRPASGGAATLLAGVSLNAVDTVQISEGSNTVTLAKRDGRWINDSLYGYPIDFTKLADALRAAADAAVGRPVRAANIDPSEYGLDQSRTILLESGGEAVARIEVGARRDASDTAGWAQQRFIRLNDAEEIYLVDYDFRPFGAEAADWIDTELLNIPSADIVEVRVRDIHLKQEGTDWKLSDLDEQTETFESSAANKLRMALQYLNCTTVADPAATDAELGFTNAVVYTAGARDGMVYTVTIGGEAADGRYARIQAGYKKPDPPAAPSDDAGQEEKDAFEQELEAFNRTCEANEKRAGEINRRLSGWTYIVSTYDADDFLITRDKLVNAVEPEEEKRPAE